MAEITTLELIRLLREAKFFVSEDFPEFPPEMLCQSDVCATPRYLQYWKDLNRALSAIDECADVPAPTVETSAEPVTWRCTICSNTNPDDATHCRQCEYSRMVCHEGRSVPRRGRL